MSYVNKGFFSNTFLKKWSEKKITKESSERIDELLYAFDILEEIPRKSREYLTEDRLKEWVYVNIIRAFDFFEVVNMDGIVEVYNRNKEKIIALDFIKEIIPLTMEFGKYQDLKVINHAKDNKFKLAILTDGYIWRIYRLDIVNYFETYLEIDISNFLITKEKEFSIQLLELFISHKNLSSDKESTKSNLEFIFKESENAIKKIEKELKGKMEGILSGIGLGFKEATVKEQFSEEESKNLYNDSIVVLYRTLFIIYAEHKGLLPVDKTEYFEVSLSKMIEDIESEKENNNVDLWEKIEKLFSWIDKGYEGVDLSVEAYNGGLFNNQGKHYLGKYAINNKHWVKVLKKLGYYEKDEQLIERIDFTDLSTRSFGTLYEGILDYNMFIASEDMVKRSKDSKVTYTPASKITPKKNDVIVEKGEIYLSEDALERKETGAYYTPEPIVEYIVNNTVDIKLDEVLGELKKDIEDRKNEIEFECNSSLKNALEKKLYEDTVKKVKEKILKISILDNAMGSGHFLVNAAYHVASKVFSFLHKNINFEIMENKEIAEYSYWVRMSVTHNIYGVDINNLAVQLGKLSLWLISASEDRPLSFIDHHLKCGNSLVGANRADIDETLGDNISKNQNRRLFDITIRNLMSYIDEHFSVLEKMPEETAEQVHKKERFYYEDIQSHLKDIKTKWDIYLAMQISDKNGIVKKENYDQIVSSNLETLERNYVDFKEWMRLAEENKFFHWELEFPEVFKVNNKGFDCIIGNPPYIDSENMVNSGLGELRDFLSKIYNCTKGNWDIYIVFFEKSLDLLNEKGICSYITPDKWTSKPFGYELRKNYLLNLKNILVAGRKIFEEVKIDSIVTILTKKINLNINIDSFDKNNKILFTNNSIPNTLIKEPFNLDILFSQHLEFILKLETNEYTLGKYGKTENACATADAYKLKPFIKNSNFDDENTLKIINTGTVDKYISKYGQREMTYLGDKYLTPTVDKNEFLKNFGNSYSQKAVKPKIIIKGLTLLDACLDEKGEIIPGKTTLIIIDNDIENLKVLLGILNSKISIFYIKEKFSASSYNGGISFTKDMINSIPIKKLKLEEKKKICFLVDKIIKKKNSKEVTFEEEKDLDRLMYEIYSLKEEEIDLIEKTMTKNK